MTARDACLKVHRWSGLAIAIFLTVAGLTGAVLAYQNELEAALLPGWIKVVPQGQPLAPFELARIAEQLDPHAAVRVINLAREENASAVVSLEGRINPSTASRYALKFDEVFLNPYTGAVLGRRLWGEIGFDAPHLLPMVHRMHYSLLLGDGGMWLFGIAALLWCCNCFVGLYLTFPVHSKRFFKGWKHSWSVRSIQSIWRLSFELHRAAGLWVWGVLLVFALSGLQFNLESQVFRPVLAAVLPFTDPQASLPARSSHVQLKLDWEAALARGRELMAQQAARQGFTVDQEAYLSVVRDRGVYIYAVRSSLDIRDQGGATRVYFNAHDGRELTFHSPAIDSGNLVSAWLSALHMRQVWGRPYQGFVSLMGLAVATLAVTGVLVWVKRRSVRSR